MYSPLEEDLNYAILESRESIFSASTARLDQTIFPLETHHTICDLVLADGYRLDYKHALLLKSKAKCGYDQVTRLFLHKTILLKRASTESLLILQKELKEIGIQTKLIPHK